MLKFMINKVLHIALVLLGITLISFMLANLSEVDPAEAYAHRQYKGASEERIAEIRQELGFDKSVPEHDPIKNNLDARFGGPSPDYPLGTDAYGRCILSRLIFGTRYSLPG